MKYMKFFCSTFSSILLMIFIVGQANGQQVSWKRLSSISLKNTTGKKENLPGGELTVIVMLSPECPLCRNYISVINQLKLNNKQIQFYGIFPGSSYAVKEIADFQKDYKVAFKLFIDPQKVLTKYLNATTTPECILLNKMGNIVYRGQIDNWAVSLGSQRKLITEKYLANAIDELLSNKNIAIKQTTPIGCMINDI